MSTDTTVVVAALLEEGKRVYTAKVVREVQKLLGGDELAYKTAEALFINGYERPWWFSTLSRAQRFAALIAEDMRECRTLEHDDQPIIEIDLDKQKVYWLSRQGK